MKKLELQAQCIGKDSRVNTGQFNIIFDVLSPREEIIATSIHIHLRISNLDQSTSLCSETDVSPVVNMNLVEEKNDHMDPNKIESWSPCENIENYDSRKENEPENTPDISNLEIEESLKGAPNNDQIMECSEILLGTVMSTEKTVKEKRSLKENNLSESKIYSRDNFSQKPLTDFQNLKLQLDLLKARENEIRWVYLKVY